MQRWFRYSEPYCSETTKIPDSDSISLVSEDYVKKVYFPRWLEAMTKKWGDNLTTIYSQEALFELCLNDFLVVYYATQEENWCYNAK
jgi:hypothetical protein